MKNHHPWWYSERDYYRENLVSRADSVSRYGFAADLERADALMFIEAATSYLDLEIEYITGSPDEKGLADYVQALHYALTLVQDLKIALGPAPAPDYRTWSAGELTARHWASSDTDAATVSAELSGARPSPLAWRADPASPGRTCQRLVSLAASVLPESHRMRYAEEFRGDLREVRRRDRLGHALRLVACAWELRRSLTASAVKAEERR
ncbi:hypothetical protein ACFQ05_22350 [Amycolatopsis umgeniensis]|uniref:Uncharacterized protein n=1 Tax=Amycolatopsis umgeniensis TaxID=336628 RepID=A0A841AUH8_9PSEU|nr:hypothetical protein [Amycolatopsis umgeniensis]MBB5849944.1 hypothetical protein [Amycolatopsis umgeniensis]